MRHVPRIRFIIALVLVVPILLYGAMNDTQALKQVRTIWGNNGVISRYLQVGDSGFTYQVGCMSTTTGRFVIAGQALVSWDAAFATVDMTANGQHTITAVATDAAGNSATSPPVTVYACNPMKLAITGGPIPDGTVGTALVVGLSAVGGSPPYAWTITSGALPPGITIQGQLLVGTPTQSGTYTFTLLVSDGTQMASMPSVTMNIH